MTTHLEKFNHSLTSELIDYIKRAHTIRSTSIIAEIDVIVVRQYAANAVEHRQSTIAGIENTYRTCILRKLHLEVLFELFHNVADDALNVLSHPGIHERHCIVVGIEDEGKA